MTSADPCIDRPTGGHLRAAIANAVMRIIADYTGRGPTAARTTIDRDWVFVTVEDTLTKGEEKLSEIGRRDFVIESRKAYQSAMREDLVRAVECLTGRKVVAFMSDNNIDPDLGIEAFLLEPDAAPATGQEDAAES